MMLVLLANCVVNIILVPANEARWLTNGCVGIASNLVVVYLSQRER
jgi:hypothetical protein